MYFLNLLPTVVCVNGLSPPNMENGMWPYPLRFLRKSDLIEGRVAPQTMRQIPAFTILTQTRKEVGKGPLQCAVWYIGGMFDLRTT